MSVSDKDILTPAQLKETFSIFHQLLINDLKSNKKNTANGRKIATTILKSQEVSAMFSDKLAAYDARHYLFRDAAQTLSLEMSKTWNNILKFVDPEQSRLWKIKDTLTSLLDVFEPLGVTRLKDLSETMTLGDLACVYELSLHTGENGVLELIVESTIQDIDTIINKLEVDTKMKRFSEAQQIKIYKAAGFRRFNSTLNEFQDKSEEKELDHGDAMMLAVQSLARLCKEGIEAVQDVEALTRKVLGARPLH
jgi:hypothetical protein